MLITRCYVFGAILLSCFLSPGQGSKPRVQSVPSSNELVHAAVATYAKFNRGYAGRREKRGETDIPPSCWDEPIKDLRPVKVYLHRVNVVVVLRFKDNVEEGKYIYQPISSYLPQNGDDGFEFTPNPLQGNVYQLHEVLDYRRLRGK